MSGEVHVGDIGTIFKLSITDQDDAALDISSATTKQILFRKPDGTTLTKAGVFDTDGTDGVLNYTIVSGDIDQVGGWTVQAYVVLPTGAWHSSLGRFAVEENLG